tara:strand:- start:231 stop:515 length:285 start_codon:yes stop_codon:yes gene_type:complete
MQVDPRMYKRQMTEEEERLMMAQGLRGNNNMMVADATQSSDFTTGNLPMAMPGSGAREVTDPSAFMTEGGMSDEDTRMIMDLQQQIEMIKQKYR